MRVNKKNESHDLNNKIKNFKHRFESLVKMIDRVVTDDQKKQL